MPKNNFFLKLDFLIWYSNKNEYWKLFEALILRFDLASGKPHYEPLALDERNEYVYRKNT